MSKKYHSLIAIIVILAFFVGCSNRKLDDEYERRGEVLERFDATEEDLTLIERDWFLADIQEAKAILMEKEISLEFTLKDKDKKLWNNW